MWGFLGWLETHGRWHRLKTLGNSSLVKASVLMPAFGYILLLNENVHQYLTIRYDGWLLHYLPSIWRVWLLFYGSFVLALATVLYSAFCPPEIKRYNSAFEMASGEVEHKAALMQYSDVQNILKSMYQTMSRWELSVFPLDRRPVEINFGELNTARDRMSAALVYHWNIADIRSPALRVSILLQFIVGLGLLAVPAVFTFGQVTILALKRIFW